MASSSDSKTIYDVLYANDNPEEFYGDGHLMKTGGCVHLVKLKQKYKHDQQNQDNLLDNYRSLVRYSLAWHGRQKTVGRKRKQIKEVNWNRRDYCLYIYTYISAFSCRYLSAQLVLTLYQGFMFVYIVFILDVGKRGIFMTIKKKRNIILVPITV
jgi:hypothetical protein